MKKTFSVTLSRGIIDKLEDDELEGVIAHELSHIRNRDVRLMIVSIIFVGIFAFIAEIAFRSIQFGALSRGQQKERGRGYLGCSRGLGSLLPDRQYCSVSGSPAPANT